MKHEWVVRVINPVPSRPTPFGVQLPGLWIEQFRRLGIVRVVREYDGSEPGIEIFDIHVDSEISATMNAERMRSFGIKADAVRIAR